MFYSITIQSHFIEQKCTKQPQANICITTDCELKKKVKSQSSVVKWLWQWANHANLGEKTTTRCLGGSGFKSHSWYE